MGILTDKNKFFFDILFITFVIKYVAKDNKRKKYTIKIDPEKKLPEGSLFNQFIFSDKSTKSI